MAIFFLQTRISIPRYFSQSYGAYFKYIVQVHTRTVNVCAMLMISYVILKYASYDWLKYRGMAILVCRKQIATGWWNNVWVSTNIILSKWPVNSFCPRRYLVNLHVCHTTLCVEVVVSLSVHCMEVDHDNTVNSEHVYASLVFGLRCPNTS